MKLFKKKKKNKDIMFAKIKDQEEFIEHGLKLFDVHQIDWEKYQEENPDIDMEKIKKKVGDVKGWETIGYQRVLGGFFYDWGIEIIGFFLGALILPLYIFIFIPYPSAEGYRGVASGFFNIIYFYFDIATRYGLERFIGEYRVKNPRKMLGYLQFYIWYQMFTGLVQVTWISYIVFNNMLGGDLGYLAWLFLIYCSQQYPGMLGYFRDALKGLQQFKWDNILEFLGGRVFEFFTSLFFILLFRWIGQNDPRIGDLMGAAIGAAIGKYLDDFIRVGTAMYFFNKVMKPYGISARDCFGYNHIDLDIVKNALWWGIQLSLPGMLGTSLSFFNLLITITYLPQYAHWATIAGLSDFIANLMGQGRYLNMKAATAEAYMNGKTELAQYYFSQSFRWLFLMMSVFLGIVLVYMPMVLDVVMQIEAAENYLLAIPFMIPMTVWRIFDYQDDKFDDIIIGTNHPTAKTLYSLGGSISGTIWHFFTLAILAWHVKFGLNGIIMIYTFAGFGGYFVFLFIRWIFIEYHVFHVKIPVWQGIIAPLLSAGTIIPVGLFWLNFVHIPYIEPFGIDLVTLIAGAEAAIEYGPLVAGLLTLLFALFTTIFQFFFFLGFFGGWDDFGLLIMYKVYHLSGPSKPIVKGLINLTDLGVRASKATLKLHNKHPIEAKIPFIQSVQLLIERHINDVRSGFLKGFEKKKKTPLKPIEEQKPIKEQIAQIWEKIKGFFWGVTRPQWIGNFHCLILYGILISPVALFWLGSDFFTPTRVIITYVAYLVTIIAVGIAMTQHARNWRNKQDKLELEKEIET